MRYPPQSGSACRSRQGGQFRAAVANRARFARSHADSQLPPEIHVVAKSLAHVAVDERHMLRRNALRQGLVQGQQYPAVVRQLLNVGVGGVWKLQDSADPALQRQRRVDEALRLAVKAGHQHGKIEDCATALLGARKSGLVAGLLEARWLAAL